MGKSVLVTGGAGFIGSHVVDRIINDSPGRLVVLDNFHLGKERNLLEARRNFPGLIIECGSLTDYEFVRDVLKRHNIEVVFNLAVLSLPESLEKPEHVFKENTEMVLNVCRLHREGLFKTLIHFSSSEVYGTARSVPMSEYHYLGAKTTYAASKVATDGLVLSYRHNYGLDSAVIRPFNNYGPRQNEKAYAGIIPIVVNRLINNKKPIIYGDGEQTRDYLYVTETANAAVEIYNNEMTRGKIINIASGQETKIKDLVIKLINIISSGTEIVYEKPRPADVIRHVADISLAKELIGFEPKIPLSEGLSLTVDWYKNNGLFN